MSQFLTFYSSIIMPASKISVQPTECNETYSSWKNKHTQIKRNYHSELNISGKPLNGGRSTFRQNSISKFKFTLSCICNLGISHEQGGTGQKLSWKKDSKHFLKKNSHFFDKCKNQKGRLYHMKISCSQHNYFTYN